MSDEYESKSSEIRQLAALPPEKLSDGLAEKHGKLSQVAPNMAPHVHAAAVNAIQYLNSKLPFSGGELPMDAKATPSKAQKHVWLGLHDTVNNPLSVLDKVKNGTLGDHHAEAIKIVYPDLHNEIVSKMNEEMGSLKAKGQTIPYKVRSAAAKLMGSPLDSTMTPQNMQAIIASQGQQQAHKQVGPKKASGSELTQINKVGTMLATDSQARQMASRK